MASSRGSALRTPTLSMAGDSNTAGEPIWEIISGRGQYIGGHEAKSSYPGISPTR